jgi:hypothetical protein
VAFFLNKGGGPHRGRTVLWCVIKAHDPGLIKGNLHQMNILNFQLINLHGI